VVQVSPSLHARAAFKQPVAGLHESIVQALLSLQTSGSLMHQPSWQWSVVQASSSSQS